MHSNTLTLASNLHTFFQELVDQTLEGRSQRPAPVIEHYLVSLLESSALSRSEGFVESVMNGPLAVQLSSALHAPAQVRFERLVRLGDGILVLGGLFEPHLKRNGMDERYLSTLGSKAYSAASQLMVNPGNSGNSGLAQELDVLGRLSDQFAGLMSLLRDVADTLLAHTAKTANDWARLCEKWLTQRSDHLERLLRAQGIQVGGVPSLLV